MKTQTSEIFNPIPAPYFLALKDLDLLKPGAYVEGMLLEKILDSTYIEGKGNWDFLGKYLTLKIQIESAGFFITQAGLEPPAFRILETKEMAYYGMKKLVKAMVSNFKVTTVLANHQGHELSEREQKQYDATQRRAAAAAISQQQILMDDVLF